MGTYENFEESNIKKKNYKRQYHDSGCRFMYNFSYFPLTRQVKCNIGFVYLKAMMIISVKIKQPKNNDDYPFECDHNAYNLLTWTVMRKIESSTF